MNNREEIVRFVKKILAEALLFQEAEIELDHELEVDLGLDSISMASVLSKFEPLFEGRENPQELMRSLLTCEKVEDLVKTIDNTKKIGMS